MHLIPAILVGDYLSIYQLKETPECMTATLNKLSFSRQSVLPLTLGIARSKLLFIIVWEKISVRSVMTGADVMTRIRVLRLR